MQPAEFSQFAQALCDTTVPPPAGLRVVAGVDVAERFAIYRNNVHVSLIDAVADRFPVVRALVGEEFFRAMARSYVLQHKPTSSALSGYGDTFPDFVGGYEPAATLAFLGDVARIERDWSCAWAAADEEALDRASLAAFSAAQLATARIRTHAAAYLIRSAWPVDDLWQAHQQSAPDLASIQWQPQNVLITRPGFDVQLQRLDAGAAVIAQALFKRQSIADAAVQAETTDMGSALGLFLDCGMIAEVLLT